MKYGWHPDPPDFRDEGHIFGHSGKTPLGSPAKKTLRDRFPDVFSQGDLGSCVSNASAALVRYERQQLGLPDIIPSRLFIYYFARRLQGWEAIDSGCIIRDAMKVLVADGVISEDKWPYDDGPTKFKERPPQNLLHDALSHKTTEYMRLPRSIDRIARCINEGHPFQFGFSVYESFESDVVAKTGVVPMPKATEKYLGGHDMVAVGYDDLTRTVECLNSWGTEYGDHGFIHMPMDYFLEENLSDDMWMIRTTN